MFFFEGGQILGFVSFVGWLHAVVLRTLYPRNRGRSDWDHVCIGCEANVGRSETTFKYT